MEDVQDEWVAEEDLDAVVAFQISQRCREFFLVENQSERPLGRAVAYRHGANIEGVIERLEHARHPHQGACRNSILSDGQ